MNSKSHTFTKKNILKIAYALLSALKNKVDAINLEDKLLLFPLIPPWFYACMYVCVYLCVYVKVPQGSLTSC